MTEEEFKKKYPALAKRRLNDIRDVESPPPPPSKVSLAQEKILKNIRAKDAKRKREYWAKNRERLNARKKEKRRTDTEFRDKERLRSKKRYEENRDLYNARKTEWCRKNKDRFRAQWNAWYQRVKDTKRGQQLENRIRNRPLYGLAGALREFERGAIGIDELNRLYDRALARVNDAGSRGSRKK